MIRALPLFLLLVCAWWLPDQAPALDVRLLPPSWSHPLGTDHLGRDLAARVLAGGRPTIEALAAALAVVGCVGLPLGLLGATRHGAPARFAMGLLLALPGLLLAIIAAGVAGGLSPWLAGIALGLPAAGQAGLLTAELGARTLAEPHARAAVALGAGFVRVLRRHVVPALREPMLDWAAARLPRLGLGYAGFVFLGLGADLGRADWGVMVWEYRTYALDAPWLLAAPALGMAGLALALRAGLRAMR